MKSDCAPKMDEIALVRLARDGDLDAFRKLFDDNRQRIFAIAYRYAQNSEDAEDILQDTFIKAFQSLHTFQMAQEASFTAWLNRISINASIDLLRKNRKMKDKNIDSDNFDNLPSKSENQDPEQAQNLQDVRDRINAVLNTLSAKQRMIFILRHYQQLSTKEIAEYMNCSQGSVKKQLFRAISAMKEHLKILLPESHYEMQKI